MNPIPEPDFALAERMFDELRRNTFDGIGITRDAYGLGEQYAHDLIRTAAEERGLNTYIDGSGNLYVTLPGKAGRRGVRMTGSHLDSVPAGGNFDGAAGVVAGLAVLAGWRMADYTPDTDVTVMAIRAEESTWFPYSYLGSKAAFGLVEKETLDLVRADTGKTLQEHMRLLSLDPMNFGKAVLSPEKIECFVELHIEQGPTLIDANMPIGIVSAIRGSFRYRKMRWLGEYAHSGAVGRTQRRDAVRAAVLWMADMDQTWEILLRQGDDLVVTVGQLSTNPAQHAFSKVAGELDCCIDVRSIDVGVLDRYDQILRASAKTIAAATRATVEFGARTGSSPAIMHEMLVNRLKELAGFRKIPAYEMPSGAGHDAAVFAQQGVPTAMIFVRNKNGSHNPHEAMEFSDFEMGIRLLGDILADDIRV